MKQNSDLLDLGGTKQTGKVNTGGTASTNNYKRTTSNQAADGLKLGMNSPKQTRIAHQDPNKNKEDDTTFDVGLTTGLKLKKPKIIQKTEIGTFMQRHFPAKKALTEASGIGSSPLAPKRVINVQKLGGAQKVNNYNKSMANRFEQQAKNKKNMNSLASRISNDDRTPGDKTLGIKLKYRETAAQAKMTSASNHQRSLQMKEDQQAGG